MADSIDIYLPHSHRKERQAEELARAIVEDPLNTLRLLFMPDELRLSFGKAMADPDFEALQSISAKEERRLHMLAWLYGALDGEDE